MCLPGILRCDFTATFLQPTSPWPRPIVSDNGLCPSFDSLLFVTVLFFTCFDLRRRILLFEPTDLFSVSILDVSFRAQFHYLKYFSYLNPQLNVLLRLIRLLDVFTAQPKCVKYDVRKVHYCTDCTKVLQQKVRRVAEKIESACAQFSNLLGLWC